MNAKTPDERWSGIARQFCCPESLGNSVIWTAVRAVRVGKTFVLHVSKWLSDTGTLHIPQTVAFKLQATLLFLTVSPSKFLPHVCFCKHECYMVNETSPHLDLVTKELPNMYYNVTRREPVTVQCCKE